MSSIPAVWKGGSSSRATARSADSRYDRTVGGLLSSTLERECTQLECYLRLGRLQPPATPEPSRLHSSIESTVCTVYPSCPVCTTSATRLYTLRRLYCTAVKSRKEPPSASRGSLAPWLPTGLSPPPPPSDRDAVLLGARLGPSASRGSRHLRARLLYSESSRAARQFQRAEPLGGFSEPSRSAVSATGTGDRGESYFCGVVLRGGIISLQLYTFGDGVACICMLRHTGNRGPGEDGAPQKILSYITVYLLDPGDHADVQGPVRVWL